jgi:hypothetical protein
LIPTWQWWTNFCRQWIRAAHNNGVLILGTIITEFEPGKLICEDILKVNQANLGLKARLHETGCATEFGLYQRHNFDFGSCDKIRKASDWFGSVSRITNFGLYDRKIIFRVHVTGLKVRLKSVD